MWGEMRKNVKYFLLLGALFLVFLTLVLMLTPSPKSAPQRGEALSDSTQTVAQFNRQEYSGYLWRLVGVSLLLLAVLGASLWWVRKMRAQNQLQSQYRMKVLARMPLGPRQSLLVVGVGERKLLLGMTDQTVNLLSDLGPWEESEDTPNEGLVPEANTFLSVFNRLRGKDV